MATFEDSFINFAIFIAILIKLFYHCYHCYYCYLIYISKFSDLHFDFYYNAIRNLATCPPFFKVQSQSLVLPPLQLLLPES